MKLKNRVALITGGGTGMGQAMSIRFAREGAKVAVNYSRSEQKANDTVAQITGNGGTAITVRADVSCDADVRAIVQRIQNEFGGLDYLVNNAGWSTRVPHHDMEALTDEIWDRTVNINLRGVFYCVRACVPLLRERAGASIVNIASTGGITGFASSMAYAASKGGVITMTKSLARALAPAIRVNAIAPGLVRTGFAGWTESTFAEGDEITPLGQLATVEDVAETALFLASDANAMTGETIVLDGGLCRLGRTW